MTRHDRHDTTDRYDALAPGAMPARETAFDRADDRMTGSLPNDMPASDEEEDVRHTMRRGIDALERRVRANPLPMIAVAAGVGFVLQRTGIARAVVGGVLSRALSRDDEDDRAGARSPEEERLLAWLNDAYALEHALIPILENHAKDAERLPHVREKDLEHLEQTRKHAKKVKKCIEMLGGKASKSKKAVARLSGAMNSVVTEPFDDEIVRNFLADYAAENLEIASYRALIVAAKEAGHPKIAKLCREILRDEEEMAEWLEDNLPFAVRDTLSHVAESAE